MERKRHTKIKKILPEELYATHKLHFPIQMLKLSYCVKKIGGHRAKSQVISARS